MKHQFRRIAISALLGSLLGLLTIGCGARTPAHVPTTSDSYLFCFWNVENLFDDHDDHRESKADREYDTWFAREHDTLQLKLDHLSDALVKLNGGRGPDILALAEVESIRAAQLLQQALNKRLDDPALHYEHVLMKDLAAGRHIAPAILTRLPVRKDRTRLHGSRLRILEGHIEVNGHDLVVVASHWTSRVTDEHGDHRGKYGDQIYGVFKGMWKSNPKVDFLVCGDFNDTPDSPAATKHLRATGDLQAVLHPQTDPVLYNLFADKEARAGFGTHYYGGNWYIFDEIVVSPGLLDEEGWTCERESVGTANSLVRPGDKHRRPWRFGNERDKGQRGYSDHFPITVRLRVQGS